MTKIQSALRLHQELIASGQVLFTTLRMSQLYAAQAAAPDAEFAEIDAAVDAFNVASNAAWMANQLATQKTAAQLAAEGL